jgi:hypothetical protein
MRRLLTPAWLARHGLAAALIAAFLGLGWWQIRRAASGNGLSWAYAVEWPVFAGFVAFLWWREVRRQLRPDSPRTASRPEAHPAVGAGTPTPAEGFRAPVITVRRTTAAVSPEADEVADADLAAYNDYLDWLAAHPGARPADYSADPADYSARPAGDRPPAPPGVGRTIRPGD